MQLSIVIPCFNEEKNLSELFDRCAELAERIDCEIILVNNGSTDNSMQVMNSLTKDNKAFKLVHLKKIKGMEMEY
jgi:glycosyltransferase involved in cell wall biosynthesis